MLLSRNLLSLRRLLVIMSWQWVWFQRVWFWTLNSVSFWPSLSSGDRSQWVLLSLLCQRICVLKRTHQVHHRTHRVSRRTHWDLSSEPVLSKQYSARSLNPEGPTIKKIQFRSKFSISIDIFNLARKFQSRRLDFPPQKGRAAVGGSLENYMLARNLQSRSKSQMFFWSLGPLGNGKN